MGRWTNGFVAAVVALGVQTWAWAGDGWLEPEGAGGIPWGSEERPAKWKRKDRSQRLADDRFTGRSPADQPEDLEVDVRSAAGDRKFLRYVDNRLVDAWLLRVGPIDDTHYSAYGREDFRGAVVGPAEPGWVAIGDAISWTLDGRTVLHWRDRLTDTEVLASRAIPSGRYAALRPEPLHVGDASNAKVGIKGDMKKMVKPQEAVLSKCFDTATKPARARISVRYDHLGRLARVRVDTDSVTYDVESCVAGALFRTAAAPDFEGSFELYRHQ